VLWRVFATNFGVVPVAVVEPVLIIALVAGVLAVANLLAAAPALLAARSDPARLLRAELANEFHPPCGPLSGRLVQVRGAPAWMSENEISFSPEPWR